MTRRGSQIPRVIAETDRSAYVAQFATRLSEISQKVARMNGAGEAGPRAAKLRVKVDIQIAKLEDRLALLRDAEHVNWVESKASIEQAWEDLIDTMTKIIGRTD